MLMRAATVVQVLQDVLSFIACFILLVIAPLVVCIAKLDERAACHAYALP